MDRNVLCFRLHTYSEGTGLTSKQSLLHYHCEQTQWVQDFALATNQVCLEDFNSLGCNHRKRSRVCSAKSIWGLRSGYHCLFNFDLSFLSPTHNRWSSLISSLFTAGVWVLTTTSSFFSCVGSASSRQRPHSSSVWLPVGVWLWGQRLYRRLRQLP